ncbi:UNKNOWN [Stylonychia lemnae]|uniref:Uncharacterized protein n=1 Tax=Stylonychia lemnae TaxID=5949 RepID=A0A078A096_STYLE|nr:UNKNOWN [Stylonychia lemnae]|eukprot:CDW74848.1 UNKNOWN [Stylonychia lemnae]
MANKKGYNEQYDEMQNDANGQREGGGNQGNNQKSNKGKSKDKNNEDAAQDLINYKGIYYDDDQGQKYTDPENGAHFEFTDLCRRIKKILSKVEWVSQHPLEVIEQQAATMLAIDPILAHAKEVVLQREKQALIKDITGASQGKKSQQSHQKQTVTQSTQGKMRDSMTSQQMSQNKKDLQQTQNRDSIQLSQQQQLEIQQQAMQQQQQNQQQLQQQQQQLLQQQQQQIQEQQYLQKQQQILQQQHQQQMQQQQLQQALQQQQQEALLAQAKWRSKSNENQISNTSNMANSQKIQKSTMKVQEVTLHQIGIGSNTLENPSFIDTQSAAKLNNRGKTPQSLSKSISNGQSGSIEKCNSLSQNMKKMQANKMGYNESIISAAGTNITMQNQTQLTFVLMKSIQEIITKIKQRKAKFPIKQYIRWELTICEAFSACNFLVKEYKQVREQQHFLVSILNKINDSYSNNNNSNLNNKTQIIQKSTIPTRNNTDNLMPNFNNNSLAIQNFGSLAIQSTTIGNSVSKSRNLQNNIFRTTASIGSAKGINKSMLSNTQTNIDPSLLIGTSLQNQGALNKKFVDSMGGLGSGSHTKQISGSSKFNQTIAQQNTQLYSMIYQNRQKNMVSNFLKGVDQRQQQKTSNGGSIGAGTNSYQKGVGTSRNQGLNAPTATKKNNMNRSNIVGSSGSGNQTMDIVINKSLIGNRFY